jgi:DeoR/GlpR family transcriptional regulator of sugar metabolism
MYSFGQSTFAQFPKEEIRSKGKITTKEYVRLNKVSIPTAIADLNILLNAGLIKRVGRTRVAYYVLNEA